MWTAHNMNFQSHSFNEKVTFFFNYLIWQVSCKASKVYAKRSFSIPLWHVWIWSRSKVVFGGCVVTRKGPTWGEFGPRVCNSIWNKTKPFMLLSVRKLSRNLISTVSIEQLWQSGPIKISISKEQNHTLVNQSQLSPELQPLQLTRKQKEGNEIPQLN